MLMFRLIPQFAIIFCSIILGFIIVRKFHIYGLPFVFFILILRTLLEIAYKFVGEKIVDFFFPQEFKKGEATESNRVRSVDELVEIIKKIPFDKCPCDKLCNIYIRLAVYVVLFIIFQVFGLYALALVLFLIIFLVPGIALNPIVQQKVCDAKNAAAKKIEDAKQAKPAEEAPKEEEKKAEEAPKEEEKKAEEAPKEEEKPAEEAPKEEAKPAEEAAPAE